MIENFYLILFVIVFIILFLFIKLIEFIKNRKSNNNKQKTTNNSDISKYINILNSLNVIDEILDRKIEYSKIGCLIDLEAFQDKIKILPIFESGYLQIFGQEFLKELWVIIDNDQLDNKNLENITNMSLYIKNEISKLKKLI